eukprot:2531568-Prorocentrum_lima.AAC.1
MRTFATPHFWAPSWSHVENSSCTNDLLRHMRATACGLDPNAASDARLASKMLRWSWYPKAIIVRQDAWVSP